MRPDPAARMRRRGAAARRLFTALWFGISVALVAPAPAQESVVEDDVAPAPVSGILILNQERLFARSLYGQRIQRELEDASARLPMRSTPASRRSAPNRRQRPET